MVQLTEIISRDPVLTMQLLKLANSSSYGMSAQISSVQHAGVIIGLSALKNMAISILVGDMFESGAPETNAARQDLFNHSLLTACMAKQIAGTLAGGNSEEAFLGGMLHDIGKLLLADHRPTEFSEVLQLSSSGKSVEQEVRVFGVDHVTLGEACCEAWGLPGSMIDIVAEHHAADSDYASDDLKAVVAANALSGHWDEFEQEQIDEVLGKYTGSPPGCIEVQALKEAVQQDLEVMMEVRATS